MSATREMRLDHFPDSQLMVPDNDSQGDTLGIKIGKVNAEFMGTGTLVIIGCFANIPHASGEVQMLAPVAFGLAVAVSIQMYGHISGGHFNPCVTVAAVIMGKMEWILAPFYVIAQIAGGLVGYGILYLLTSAEMNEGCCVTVIHPELQLYQGFLIEMTITGFLISICCAIWDDRQSKNTDSVSIRFGLMLAAIFIATGKWTGASVNPARSFAPAVYQNIWDDHWVYWAAPFAGSIIMALSYRFTYIDGLAHLGSSKSKDLVG